MGDCRPEGKNTTRPTYVKNGIYQGDTVSPLMFLLLTAHITDSVKNSPAVVIACRGKQEVAAYMDDYKTHAPSRQAAIVIKDTLINAAAEVGLSLNLRKCRTYSPTYEEEQIEEEIDIPFLPVIRDGYKYLGLYQLDRDTPLNFEKLIERVTMRTTDILRSKLSPAQKIALYNSTVIPVATYVTMNLYPNESRPNYAKKVPRLG